LPSLLSLLYEVNGRCCKSSFLNFWAGIQIGPFLRDFFRRLYLSSQAKISSWHRRLRKWSAQARAELRTKPALKA
jgi:hypothetical protein